MKRHITHGWTLASHVKAALLLVGMAALAASDAWVARAADAPQPTPASTNDTRREEEARRVLRETVAKLETPKPAAEVAPVAPSPRPSPPVGEREKIAPLAEKEKIAAAEAVTQVAAVQDAAKATAEAQPVRTPLEKASENKTLFSFKAENLEIKKALALFARANDLNIVPDLDLKGDVTVDIKDVPLATMMQALLDAHGYNYVEEYGLIRVHGLETRLFRVDYLRLNRNGTAFSSVNLSSAGSSGGLGGAGGGGGGLGGGGGGLGGGGGGGLGGGGAGGGGLGGAGGGGGGGVSGSGTILNAQNDIKFWDELETQLKSLLTPESGKLAVNKTAGVIQVTDRPPAVRNIGKFLDELHDTVFRQVDIEAKIYDVTLNDSFRLGIDWDRIILKAGGGTLRGIGGVTGNGGVSTALLDAGTGAAFSTAPPLSLIFKNKDTAVVLQALRQQGEINVVSQPRLRTINNQTAIIKVGTDTPFFSRNVVFLPTIVSGSTTPLQNTVTEDTFQTITVGTILSITPQISTNGWISLDVSPAITSLVEERVSPGGTTTAPVLDIKQASTLVRIKSDDTIVLGGLIQKRTDKTVRKVPLLGDIPLLGKLFQGNVESKQKKELVIFLTPRIVD